MTASPLPLSLRPAWSEAFAPGVLPTLCPIPLLDDITPEWAWGGSTGIGVKVAILDSGIDADHPAVRGVQSYLTIQEGPDGLVYDEGPHGDSFGHGTACAGIIRALALDCSLFSVKVLGPDLTGRGAIFVAGLRRAIECGAHICNLSLSSSRAEFFGQLHELADAAYFRHIPLVCAANNLPLPSYPALFGVVLSVAAHEERDPECFAYNPAPPVEFGAPGIDLEVAWLGGGRITVTGNSFAAPHITGLVARILAKHPGLTVFQVKSILRALATNVARDDDEERCTCSPNHPNRGSTAVNGVEERND
jgi:subtilisin family serine protease